VNILFVCSANKQRSKTAEDYFSGKFPHFGISSAGTNLAICEKEGTNPLTEEMLIEADVILVMEEKHRQQIRKHTKGKYDHKLTVLAIEDRYKYYQAELIQLLEEKAGRFFE
jgi:predicted protein tyrosine phosphatase